MDLVSITPEISYLPASEKPLSCDIVFIKTNKATWIFDAGVNNEAAEKIKEVKGPKNIVISHFHPDHIFNLMRVSEDNLYVSKNTKKYTIKGTVLNYPAEFDEEPGIKIIELPSSHAKGCLCLICGEYCFCGDATYARPIRGHHTYNAQLLQQMIQALENLDVKYLCLSHDPNFIQNKEVVLKLYRSIYSRRTPDSPLIDVEDFFESDGSVKRDK